MTKITFLAVVALLIVRCIGQQLPLSQVGLYSLSSIDLDGDQKPDLVYRLNVSEFRANSDTYTVATRVVVSNGVSILRLNSSGPDFSSGQTVGPLGTTPGFDPYLCSFLEEFVFPTWFYFDRAHFLPDPFFTNKTSVLIGFQAQLEDSKHYGWLQFDRSSTAFTNFFQLTKWDWNPIPDATIRAGFPPEIPLNTELVSDGAETVLRLSWPGAVANWILESTTSLTAPIEWEFYPTGGASVDVPVGEASDPVRYFRLRQP
ncbi:MAG: hypothetical protein J0M24_15460 [Verrucomicrobia bacterium]|nr:hypothetical protein [Verrucomicrobiota bacterium]